MHVPPGAAAALLAATLALAGPAAGAEPDTLVHVVAGPVHSCALGASGRLYCWDVALSSRSVSDAARPVIGLPLLRDFDLGDRGHDCGVDRDGAVICWDGVFDGTAEGYKPTRTYPHPAPTRFVAVSTGYTHICALDADGGVWCAGLNPVGELGTGDTNDSEPLVKVQNLDPAVSVSAGVNNTCAITTDGRAWCWGTDVPGMPSKMHFFVDSLVPQLVEAIPGDLLAVHNGRNFMCATSRESQVVCWGSNILGQLGVTRELLHDHAGGFSRLLFQTSVTSVGAGFFDACAVSGRQVFCWGTSEFDKEQAPIIRAPTLIVGLPQVKEVSVNADNACVLGIEGDIWCWGSRPAAGTEPKRQVSQQPWRIDLPAE
jgi:alpha-tubulin suppressor-like RCC1 family protein